MIDSHSLLRIPAVPRVPERRSGQVTDLAFPDDWLFDAWGARRSHAGVRVNERTALTYSTIWACVNIISQDLSSQPCPAYERKDDDSREVLRSHPAHQRLNRRANPELSGLDFRKTLTAHVLTWGNGYAEIQRNGAGEVAALWPIEPDRVRVERKAGRLVYFVRRDDRAGIEEQFAPEDIFHIRGLSWNGLQGYSPIRQHMELIGWGVAQRESSSRFFGQGTRTSGFLVSDNPLGPEAAKQLKEQWQAEEAGITKFHKTPVMHSGLKWQSLSVPPDEAQFVETQKLTRSVIAGEIYRIALHLIGEIDKAATYSSVEQFFLAHRSHTLLPWARTWETEALLKLVSEADQESERVYVEHNFDNLLRGDTLTRASALKMEIESGTLTPNEGRQKQNRRKLPGLDEPRGALNIGPIQEDGTVLGPPPVAADATPPAAPAQNSGVISLAAARIFQHQVARLVRKELAAVRKAIARCGNDPAGWQAWLDEFYRDLAAEAAPLVAARHFSCACTALKQSANPAELLAAWEQTRAQEILAAELAEMEKVQ